jgi:hypothetical protein
VDTEYPLDLDALRKHLETGDHAVFRFTGVDERLFVDFRPGQDGQPGIMLLPPARSMRARIRTIADARPGVPAPDQVTIVAWPLRIGSLDRLGVLEQIRERLATMDAFKAIRNLDAVYTALLAAEREEFRRAITGEGYRTIWPPPATREESGEREGHEPDA